jgi:hypothetical protein
MLVNDVASENCKKKKLKKINSWACKSVFLFSNKKIGNLFCLSRVNFTHFANFQEQKCQNFKETMEEKIKP